LWTCNEPSSSFFDNLRNSQLFKEYPASWSK
jgi:hypothetical protein